MNIAIGTNLFKPNIRQDLCIESLLKLKQLNKNNIELFNLQFKNRYDEYIDDRLNNMFILETNSSNYIEHTSKRLPLMNEMFDKLADMDYDYFCFTNNDIIVSDRYIKHIINTNYETYPASRLAIQPIQTLNDKVIPSHYQVAGFDTFCVETKWWKVNKDKFETYFLGMPAWDVDYATVMLMYSNCSLCNKWPAPIFHIVHESPWMESNKVIPERTWNEDMFFNKNKERASRWNNYLFSVLLKRPNNYWTPFENEETLEKRYFKI